jgi:hypothetical protein
VFTHLYQVILAQYEKQKSKLGWKATHKRKSSRSRKWSDQHLRWWRELHLWRYHVAKVLRVLEHNNHLLIVDLLQRIYLLLVSLMPILYLPLQLSFLPLPLGPLCCKLGLKYLIQTLEYKETYVNVNEGRIEQK